MATFHERVVLTKIKQTYQQPGISLNIDRRYLPVQEKPGIIGSVGEVNKYSSLKSGVFLKVII